MSKFSITFLPAVTPIGEVVEASEYEYDDAFITFYDDERAVFEVAKDLVLTIRREPEPEDEDEDIDWDAFDEALEKALAEDEAELGGWTVENDQPFFTREYITAPEPFSPFGGSYDGVHVGTETTTTTYAEPAEYPAEYPDDCLVVEKAPVELTVPPGWRVTVHDDGAVTLRP